MLTQTRSDVIKFDLKALASKENDYDKNLPHRYGTEVVFAGGQHGDYSMSLGTLIALTSIFEVMRQECNQGPILDKFYDFLRAERGNDAVTQAIDLGEVT